LEEQMPERCGIFHLSSRTGDARSKGVEIVSDASYAVRLICDEGTGNMRRCIDRETPRVGVPDHSIPPRNVFRGTPILLSLQFAAFSSRVRAMRAVPLRSDPCCLGSAHPNPRGFIQRTGPMSFVGAGRAFLNVGQEEVAT
jgi:hypothetical protein